MKTSSLYAPLAYAGALPFVFCAALFLIGIDSLPVLGSVSTIAKTYSLAIVAFMSGSHWGTWQHVQTPALPMLPVWSNAITLAMWFALLLTPPAAASLAAAACFAVLLGLDARLRHLNVVSAEYFIVRRNVSAVVLVSLLTMAYAEMG